MALASRAPATPEEEANLLNQMVMYAQTKDAPWDFSGDGQITQTTMMSPVAMRWFSERFGNNVYFNRNADWGVGGMSLPAGLDGDVTTADPQFTLMALQHGRRLNRMRRNVVSGRFSPLRNRAKARRWGESLFVFGHELGHNRQPTWSEEEADWYAHEKFRRLGRQIGLNRQQIRRMWRANDRFSYAANPNA